MITLKKQILKVLPILIPVLLVMIWQGASSLNLLSENILASPLEVVKAGKELFLSGELMRNLTISLYRATVGFAIGGMIGFLLGLLTGLSDIGRSF